MAPDLPSCEWSPGTNRSLVDPIFAVTRLDMPLTTRTALVEKLRRRAFDDLVLIDRSSIRSESGRHQYEAAISNMNFGAGRLCHKVTRDKWTAAQQEGAMVYIVNGRAFGYAAACGNLFELVRREPPPKVVEAPPAAPVEPPPPVVVTLVAPPAAPSDPGGTPTTTWVERAGAPLVPPLYFGGSGGITTVTWTMPPAISPPVPEPETWLMFMVGLLAVGWGARRGR